MAPIRRKEEEKTAYEKWQEERASRKPVLAERVITQTKEDRQWKPSKDNSKGYQWEKDLLGGIKGKSYNDKFDKLMASMGVTSTQEKMGFRNYMDDMENSAERRQKDEEFYQNQTNYNFEDSIINEFKDAKNFSYENPVGTRTWKRGEGQSFTPAGEKDKEMAFSEYDNALRKASEERQAARQVEQDEIQNPLVRAISESGVGRGLTNQIARVGSNFVDMPERTSDDPMQQAILDADRGGALGVLDDTLAQVSRGAWGAIDEDDLLRRAQDQIEREGELNPVLAAQIRDGGLADKLLRGTGRFAGEAALFARGASALGPARAATGGRRIAQEFGRGAAVEGGVSAGREAFQDAGNPDGQNLREHLTDIGTNALIGGAADAGLGALVRGLNLRGQAQGMMDDLRQGYTEGFQRGVPETLALPEPKFENLTPSAVGNQIPSVEDPFETVLRERDMDGALRSLDEITQQEDELRNAFVSERMADIDEQMMRVANAENEWIGVQQAKQRRKEVASVLGKNRVYINPELNSDWKDRLPKALRAAKPGSGKMDMYQAAESLGYPGDNTGVEQMLSELENLYSATNVRKRDLLPEGDNLNRKQYEELYDSMNLAFEETDDFKGLEQLRANIINELPNLEEPRPIDPQAQLDEALDFLGGQRQVTATPEVAATSEPDSPFLMRSNLQFHNNTEALSDSLINKSPNNLEPEQMTNLRENPIRRTIDKAYEAVINSRHGLKVGDEVVTERAIKDTQEKIAEAMEKGENTEVLQRQVAKLEKRLKNIKKNGSQLEKASTNEEAVHARTNDILDRHLAPMYEKIENSDVAIKDAVEYLMAKNLDRIMQQDKKFGLPPEWSYERIRNIIDTTERGTPEKRQVVSEFTKDWKGMMDELRQIMLDSGLKSPEEIELLAQNEHYIPLFRDRSWRYSQNVDKTSNRGNANRLDAKAYLFDLEGGNQTDYFKNPVESIIEMTNMIVRQAYKNDTAKELLKLAELDVDGNMVRLARGGDKNNIISGYENGERFDLVVSDDVFDILTNSSHPKEALRSAQKIQRGLEAATRTFAGLKTRSLSHQLVATPRDLIQGYINSDVNNPFTYIAEIVRSVKSGHLDAKKVGGIFQHGYNDHTGGADNHRKLVDEFKKELGIKEVDISKPKQVAQSIKKLLDNSIFAPARVLGQQSDSVVRNIEARHVQQKYQREMELLQKQLDALPPQTEFEPTNIALDRQELTERLAEIPAEMQREMTYQARDMMNYQRTGRSKFVKDIIKPYVIFANTTTQSKDKFFRSFVKNPGMTVAKLSVPVAGMAALQEFHYQNASPENKEKYDLAPDYFKNYYWTFPVGDDFITIPKPHEAVPIISAIEAGLSQGLNHQQAGSDWNELARLIVKEYVPLQAGNFAQGVVPDRFGEQGNVNLPSTLPTIGANIMSNEKLDFNRKPITYGSDFNGESNFFIPEGMEQEDVSADYTSQTAKLLSGNQVNADYTDYAIRQLLGDLGKYGLGGGDLALNAAQGQATPDQALELLRQLSIDGYLRPAYSDREKEQFLGR